MVELDEQGAIAVDEPAASPDPLGERPPGGLDPALAPVAAGRWRIAVFPPGCHGRSCRRILISIRVNGPVTGKVAMVSPAFR
jgi:hypothetical protein